MAYGGMYLGIVAAAVVSFILGWLWHGPLFGKAWMRLMKYGKKDLERDKAKGMSTLLAAAFVSNLVLAFVIATVLSMAGAGEILSALYVGFLLWLGLIATVMLGGVLWENKSVHLYVFNVIYHLVNLLVVSAVLSYWI